MASFACTSTPTRSTRSAWAGGLPKGSPDVADVTPTRDWAEAVADMATRAPSARVAKRAENILTRGLSQIRRFENGDGRRWFYQNMVFCRHSANEDRPSPYSRAIPRPYWA